MQMDTRRLSNGERISCVSAILLFVLMFFRWFDVKLSNTSNLLFDIQSIEPGKNAWEALDYTPIVLVITIAAALAVATLNVTGAVRRSAIAVNVVIAILGLVSMLLILFRIVDPPVFYVEPTIRSEGAVQITDLPCSVGCGGDRLWQLYGSVEEGFSLASLRPRPE